MTFLSVSSPYRWDLTPVTPPNHNRLHSDEPRTTSPFSLQGGPVPDRRRRLSVFADQGGADAAAGEEEEEEEEEEMRDDGRGEERRGKSAHAFNVYLY